MTFEWSHQLLAVFLLCSLSICATDKQNITKARESEPTLNRMNLNYSFSLSIDIFIQRSLSHTQRMKIHSLTCTHSIGWSEQQKQPENRYRVCGKRTLTNVLLECYSFLFHVSFHYENSTNTCQRMYAMCMSALLSKPMLVCIYMYPSTFRRACACMDGCMDVCVWVFVIIH